MQYGEHSDCRNLKVSQSESGFSFIGRVSKISKHLFRGNEQAKKVSIWHDGLCVSALTWGDFLIGGIICVLVLTHG